MINRISRWCDRNLPWVIAVLALCALWILCAPRASGQSPTNQRNVPALQTGDVLYIDGATNEAYLLWHACNKHFEIIAPYTQDEAMYLLLQREQSAWAAFYKYQQGIWVAPPKVVIPGVTDR